MSDFDPVTMFFPLSALSWIHPLSDTKQTGFMNARSWLADVRAHADPQLTCILVGNKVDLCTGNAPSKPREVSTKEAEMWAKEEGLLFVEASAKSGENVEEAFLQAAIDILGKIRRGVFDDNRVSNVTSPGAFKRFAKSVTPSFSHRA